VIVGGSRNGTADAIAADGRLTVVLDDGETTLVGSGEVEFAAPDAHRNRARLQPGVERATSAGPFLGRVRVLGRAQPWIDRVELGVGDELPLAHLAHRARARMSLRPKAPSSSSARSRGARRTR
jgi:hypothetical protein